MLTEFGIVPLDMGNAAVAAGLIRTAFAAQSVVTDPPSSALRETTETIAAAIAGGGGAMAVAEGEMVGAVLWAEQDQGLYLGRLSVLPGWRGRGIARALIAAAEDAARRRALPRVQLSTRLALADNRRLFAACGYREAAMRAHDGYAVPTYVVMEKSL